MPAPDAVTVLIADDHAEFIDGMRLLLEHEPDVEIVGQADSGTAAVDAVTTLQPDVVLMDLQMPGMNGIEATRHISLAAPNVAVVVLSMFDDDDSVFLAMRAGARGYLLKGASRADLVRAILAVNGGDAIFGPGIAHRVLQYFAGRDSLDGVFPELTTREREILDHIASGQTNAAIAVDLFLSPKTVRNHISNIFAKLRVAGRAEAIIIARNAGLGPLEPPRPHRRSRTRRLARRGRRTESQPGRRRRRACPDRHHPPATSRTIQLGMPNSPI